MKVIGRLLLLFFAGITFYSCNKQVSVSPPDAPPPNGFVFIDSYPEGFDIYLDNKDRRRMTPDSLNWLSTGTYKITLKKDLFRDSSFTLNVVEGKRQHINIDFSKNPSMLGSISCNSQPEGAQILINDTSTGKITPATLNNILPGNYVIRYSLQNYQDVSSDVDVSSLNLTNVNLRLIDTTLWYEYTTDNSPIKTDDLTCIAVDKNDVVWMGTIDWGVFHFNGNTWGGTELYLALPNSHVNCITIDDNNRKYFGTRGGFTIYDGVNTYTFGREAPWLTNKVIEAIGFDKEDTMYLGTHGGLMNGYTGMFYDSSKVPDYWITAIFNDNSGNLWIGTHNLGIAVKHDHGKWERWYTRNCPIINNYIRAFAQEPSGNIWVGFGTDVVSGGELSVFNGTTWQNSFIIPGSSQTAAILIDKNNTKWVATDQGLVKFTSGATAVIYNYGNTGVNINNTTGLARDSKGNIWISTLGGGLVEYKGDR